MGKSERVKQMEREEAARQNRILWFWRIAGIVLASRTNSGQPAVGTGFETDAIAAAVIGGTSMSGGEGSMIGTLIGIILLCCLYIVTLILAIIGNENTTPWFMACICATIIVPILIWVYTWLYNRLRQDVNDAREKYDSENIGDEDRQ